MQQSDLIPKLMKDVIKIIKRRAGKDKGTTSFLDSDDKRWKAMSKYRKRPSNRFNTQKRFLSLLDLAEMRHMEAVTNSQIKRGEKKRGNLALHYVCGCGVEGCVGHNEYQQEKTQFGTITHSQSEFK